MKISCIIPAYNEETRIGAVLHAVTNSPLLDEVIVVDDGSKDQTSAVAAAFPVKLITLKQNQGKSSAIVEGVKAASNEMLMFIDADLLGLTPEGIAQLAQPVLEGKADVSISLRENSLLLYRFFGLDFVSGERVLPKSLLSPVLEKIAALPGFGLEVYMNNLIIEKGLRLKVVHLRYLITPRKSKKIGYIAGQKADWEMIKQILSVMGLGKIVRQFLKMLALKV